MEHYRFKKYVPKTTYEVRVSNIIAFRRHHLTQSTVTPEHRLQKGINLLMSALQDNPQRIHDTQLEALTKLCKAFAKCSEPLTKDQSHLPANPTPSAMRHHHHCRAPISRQIDPPLRAKVPASQSLVPAPRVESTPAAREAPHPM